MKLTIRQLRQIVTEILSEAAVEGATQKKYRDSYKRMVKLAAKGGIKNSPPFTKSPTVGKSGPPDGS
jgi:hypothetical protein